MLFCDEAMSLGAKSALSHADGLGATVGSDLTVGVVDVGEARASLGLATSSGETTHGPIGPYLRDDLPSENCDPAANCRWRSLMS